MYLKEYSYEEDYSMLTDWVKELGQVAPPMYILPTGAIVMSDDDEAMAMGFVYYSKYTPVSVVEWVFINPSLTPKLKKVALETLIDALCSLAICEGQEFIMAGSNNSGVVKQFLKQGFMLSGEKFRHMVKIPTY